MLFEQYYENLYAEINILCMLLPIGLIVKLTMDKKKAAWHLAFRRCMEASAALLFLEAIWIKVDGNVASSAIMANEVLNNVYFLVSAIMGYYWFWFTLYRLKSKRRQKSIFGFIMMLPLLLICALLIANAQTDCIFVISSSNGYSRGPLHVAVVFFAYLYLFLAMGYASYVLMTQKDKAQRTDSAVLLSFMFLFFMGFLMNYFDPYLPSVVPLMAIGFTLIYIFLINSQVMIDSLTKVNNRRQFDLYIKEKVKEKNRSKKLYMMLFDMDEFKSINDSHGHDVGDQALKAAADALKKVYGQYGGFIARYGGDEFAAIIEAEDMYVPSYLSDELNRELARINKEDGYPFELSISIGIAEFAPGTDDEISFFKKADLDMYQNKKDRKVGR